MSPVYRLSIRLISWSPISDDNLTYVAFYRIVWGGLIDKMNRIGFKGLLFFALSGDVLANLVSMTLELADP